MTRSVQTLEEALVICLDNMPAGMTPAQCLARYPEYGDQLGALLLTAERLQGQVWPTLSISGRVRGRERMHAALASRRTAGFAWWLVLRPLSVAIMLLVLAAGVWLASPGRELKNTDLLTPEPVVLPITPTLPFTLAPTTTPTATLTSTRTITPRATSAVIGPDPELAEVDLLKMLIAPNRTMTPSATVTSLLRNASASGVKRGTPDLTQAPTPTVTSGADKPQQSPHDDRAPDATTRPTETHTPPKATPTPSRTRKPEGSPAPLPTAAANVTRQPTATRQPTETTQPTSTPRPLLTSGPPHEATTRESTKTPEPSEPPEPTKTPKVAKTPDHD